MAETNSDIQKFVEDVIEKAFEKVQKAYDNHREFDVKQKKASVPYEDTSIVFPMYGEHITNQKDKTRISEQELRFAFVEAFNEENKDKKYYYSVETPTNSKYLFKGKNTPRIISRNKSGGKSGQFDLVIHDSNLKRVCLIEFKAGNPGERDFKKDLLKLANSNEDVDKTDRLRYFIHLVENGFSSYEKIRNVRNWLPSANGLSSSKEVRYVCYSLEQRGKILDKYLSEF